VVVIFDHWLRLLWPKPDIYTEAKRPEVYEPLVGKLDIIHYSVYGEDTAAGGSG